MRSKVFNQAIDNNIDSYRPDIDGLRAIAVLSVVIFHAFPTLLRGGFVGVDVFFVISGYLISQILFKNLERSSFSLIGFYARRIRRIFPALILVLLCCLIFGYFVLYEDEYALLAKHVSAGSSFVSNFLLWYEVGYFDKAAELKPLLHLWSLGIEEQFYIFWPCLVVLAWRRSFNFWLFIGLFFLVSLILSLVKVHHHASLTFYFPLMRAWELLLGAAFAYAVHRDFFNQFEKYGFINELKAVMGLLLLGGAVFLFNKQLLFPGGWALLPTVGTLLLISSSGALINRKVLANPYLVGLGLISYPLYLWHWPLFSYAHIILGDGASVSLMFFLLMLSIFLAYMTYQWVEKPLRFLIAPRYAVIVLCMGLVCVGVLGFYVYRMHGLPLRPWVLSQKASTFELNNFYDYKSTALPCGLKTKDIDKLSLCFKLEKKAPTHVFWGDSHAEHLFPGILAKAKQQNWMLIGHSGCPPLLNTAIFKLGAQDVCAKNNAIVLKAILDTPSVETVVLASLGGFYIKNDTGYATQLKGDNSPMTWRIQSTVSDNKQYSKAELFYQGMDATIRELEAHGKKVVLYQDVPEIPFMPLNCLGRPFTSNQRNCDKQSKIIVENNQKEYKALLLTLQEAHPKLRIFDVIPHVCDKASCYARYEGHFIYRDSHHLSTYGSTLLAKPFLAWLDGQNKTGNNMS